MHIDPTLVNFVFDSLSSGIIGGAAYTGVEKMFVPIFGDLLNKWRNLAFGQNNKELKKKIESTLEKDESIRKRIENLPLYSEYKIKIRLDKKISGVQIINNFFSLPPLKVIDNKYIGKINSILAVSTFTGRKKDLKILNNLLSASENKAVLLVNGLGGIGKTTLAKQFVATYQNKYDHICLIDYQTTLLDSFLAQIVHTYPKDDSPQELFQKIIADLNNFQGNNLLVIDNFDNENDQHIRDLPAIGFKILITSRSELSFTGMKKYELDTLPQEVAKRLFYTYRYSTIGQETELELKKKLDSFMKRVDKDLEALLEKIGYHTLTIEIFAKTLKEDPRIPLKELLSLKGKINVETDNDKTRQTKIENFLNQLFPKIDLEPKELNILQNLSALPSIDISYLDLLELLKVNQRDRHEFINHLNSLAKKGWLIKTEKENHGEKMNFFRCHQIIQELIKKNNKYKPTFENCQKCIDSLILKLTVEGKDNPLLRTKWIPYSVTILETIQTKEHKTATLATKLSWIYEAMGNFSKALIYGQKAIKIKEKVLASNHPDLATSYSNVSIVYRSMGNFSKALIYGQKAIKIKEKVLAPNHPDLAASYNNISIVYQNLGDLPKALEYGLKAIKIKEEVLSPNHPDLATSYNNITTIYRDMKDLPKALEYGLKAVKIEEEVLSPNHPHLGLSYHNLSLVNKAMKNLPKALEYEQKAIKIQKKILALNHPDLALSYDNISLVYSAMKDLSKALEYGLKALKIREEVLDSSHPQIANSYVNLCSVYYYMNDYRTARKYIEKAIAIRREIFSKGHHSLKNSLGWQALIEKKLN